MRRAWSLAIAVGIAGTGGAGRAEPAPTPEKIEEVVELRYRAPPGCPGRDALIELIRERAPGARFAAGARRAFEISVTAGEHGYTGALVVDATADKQLAATRCDDLVTALALVIALAIDPTAAAPRDSTAAAPRDQPAAAPAPGPAAAVTRLATDRPPAAPPRVRTLDASIGGALALGVTPDPLLAGSLAARRAWPALAAEVAILAGRDTTRTAAASASFTRLVARPAACRLATRRGIELGGCAHAEIGLVHATGGDIINSRGLTRLWAAAGAHGILRWPGPTSRGFVQLQLGGTAAITRDRYRFMPGIVIYETPPVSGWLGLGAGLRFP
jgi:hypothetical protein